MAEKNIRPDDLVLICYRDRKYLKKVDINSTFSGKGGNIIFSELVGRPFGIIYGAYEIYRPTLEDIIMFGIKRDTQIIYPKDAAYICFKLNITSGARVLELGTGSGAMTLVFSFAVGAEGRVITVEKEERHFRGAKRNIERFSIFSNVEMINCDIFDYKNTGFESIFIDVREPWLYMEHIMELANPSASLGMIVPTTNQISEILKAFETHKGFGNIEICEIMLRKYKTISERIRPFDRMVAHTGYLIFARRIKP
ncbi:MAG TPA: methyltransferase domain-containing protein [Syntrophorhabdaceae bacterium]|nr:methyltransferase domain-containing protein [Syntrophorhabdaceae bacterium]